nr:DUF1796 family putative cysteine peptidase [Novosphingobium panipatense]
MGTHYQASSILKKYGLKSQSFPFDWLFSSPDAILHCIQDNFDKFLDKSYYKSLEPKNGEARADHEFYKKFYNVDSFFAHRDPVKADDHQFFMRCVDRFREIVGGGSAKLFVMISGNHHDLVGTFEKLHEWVSKLDSANIIAIQLRDPMDGRSLRKVRAESHGDLYEFSPKSAEEGLGFPDLLDDLTVLKLVAEYQITQNARSARRSMG